MDNVRCHYVYDEEEKIVHVDDVSRDTAKSHRYHCISCGAEMIPKLGNLNESTILPIRQLALVTRKRICINWERFC